MNPAHPAAHEKALFLCSALGRRVQTSQGEHQGEVGLLISVTQPPFREPLMDLPGDPPLPYATVRWPSKSGEPPVEDHHQVADITLYVPEVTQLKHPT